MSAGSFSRTAAGNRAYSLSQLHKQFMSPISLVQLNWYCESGGDNDKTLTWGRDLINLSFHEDVYRRSIFFFLARSPIFLKRTKEKDKTTSVYTVRVKGGMSLRNGMWHGVRNDIIMWNVKYAE